MNTGPDEIRTRMAGDGDPVERGVRWPAGVRGNTHQQGTPPPLSLSLTHTHTLSAALSLSRPLYSSLPLNIFLALGPHSALRRHFGMTRL